MVTTIQTSNVEFYSIRSAHSTSRYLPNIRKRINTDRATRRNRNVKEASDGTDRKRSKTRAMLSHWRTARCRCKFR